jgi:predicted HicB family RNase H-like nuclease
MKIRVAPRSGAKRAKLTLRLRQSLRDNLQVIANREGRSLAYVIECALTEYVTTVASGPVPRRKR